ncbi:aldo/keto reductase [Cellulosilyticum sp. I15G10I2]|uniref:aldo/keto reductase n=1 Tax=Cellulosilyticum sp. I15G10I2 TaxID=1892843 RepID=UPI002E8E3E31|nr:aldo/keto reductase [Cellulosilyticum sp. I15G10I2]
MPKLGQGTWYMGENPGKQKDEIEALRLGIDLGMTLIDTAEMYADGGAECVAGEAIKNMRDKVFLVSKVYPHNAGLRNIAKNCENSLKRLQTDHLDLYLLHWRGSIPLEETIEGMENLIKTGKILRWGVSNFDTRDMKELVSLPKGSHCAVNQVLYHLGSRGIEYDLINWQKQNSIPIMAYCPIAQAGTLRRGLIQHPDLKKVADKHHATPIQILLAWCMRHDNMIAIPKASNTAHVLENARVNTFTLDQEDLQKLDQIFPAPSKKVPLDIV